MRPEPRWLPKTLLKPVFPQLLSVSLLIVFILEFSPYSHAQVDLSGTYNISTLTPVQRPAMYGENLYLSHTQAEQVADQFQQYSRQASKGSDPDRKAPPEGGKVGGYNAFWIDRGEGAIALEGRFRTSLITHPSNGRIPAMNDQGAARMAKILDDWRIIWRNPDPSMAKDSSSAWWLKEGNGTGPYDDLEQRPLAERCIIGSRSTAGPPMLPNYYNNFKRIVQTKDHVMILTEMNHDARIVRMNAMHGPAHVSSWLGDSIGRWEGDTLVIHTNKFRAEHSYPPILSTDLFEVEERLSLTANDKFLYQYTVTDPNLYTQAFTAEVPFTRMEAGRVLYEYACHEGNYSWANSLRGARMEEGNTEN